MNDLEERLRTSLNSAADSFELEIDPEGLLRSGRAARRSRVARRATLAAALLVVFSGLSALVAPPLIAAIMNKQTLPFSTSFHWNGEKRSEFDNVSVELVRDQRGVTLTASGLRHGRRVASAEQQLPNEGVSRILLGTRTIVAVFPGEIQRGDLVTDVSVMWESSWSPAFGVTVSIAQLTRVVPDPDELDWLWVDASGAVRHADSSPVASGRIVLDGTECLVYRDDRSGHLGVWSRVISFSFALSDYHDADLLDGGMGTEKDSVASEWQLGVLPTGAHDVRLVLSKPSGAWGTATLADGAVVVLATVPGEPHHVITSFSYLTSAGALVRYPR